MLSPVLAVAVTASGLGLMMTTSSQAAPVKLYFHSANGGYLQDIAADPESDYPAGSTLDAKAPTATTDSEARSGNPYPIGGLPLMPTFALPYVGDVTSVCLDVWVKSTLNVPLGGLLVVSSFSTPDDDLALTDYEATPYDNGALVRVTGLVKPDGVAKHTIPKDTYFLIHGYTVNDNDMTLVYDSVTHPSSITINPTTCKAPPVVVPSATATPSASASATATPKPSPSASTVTATPSATATAAPSGSATATPAPSGTPVPSESPSPTPSPTPPPPAQETNLDYTGPSRARYGDMAVVSARMTLADGSPVPAGAVEFTLGTVVVRYNVDANGVATGRLPVKVAAGEHVVTARYRANAAYLGAAEQAPFTVTKMPTRCAISRASSGSSYVVTGTLRDAAGRAMAGQSMHFLFNDRTWKAVTTDRNGRASVTVAAKHGKYGIAFPANAYYAGCSASFTV